MPDDLPLDEHPRSDPRSDTAAAPRGRGRPPRSGPRPDAPPRVSFTITDDGELDTERVNADTIERLRRAFRTDRARAVLQLDPASVGYGRTEAAEAKDGPVIFDPALIDSLFDAFGGLCVWFLRSYYGFSTDDAQGIRLSTDQKTALRPGALVALNQYGGSVMSGPHAPLMLFLSNLGVCLAGNYLALKRSPASVHPFGIPQQSRGPGDLAQ